MLLFFYQGWTTESPRLVTMSLLRIGSIWRHTRRQVDVVIVQLAKCHATKEPMVVYRDLVPTKDNTIPSYFLARTNLCRRERLRFEYVDTSV